MSEPNNQGAAAPKPTLLNGLGMLVGVFVFASLWVGIGSALHLHSFFASFVFVWYWGVMDRMAFNRLAPALLGSLVGVALAWQLSYFTAHFGAHGLALGVGIIAVAVFVQFMNWVPMLINLGGMLFLAILTAPQFGQTDFRDVGLTILASAVYASILVFVIKRFMPAHR